MIGRSSFVFTCKKGKHYDLPVDRAKNSPRVTHQHLHLANKSLFSKLASRSRG